MKKLLFKGLGFMALVGLSVQALWGQTTEHKFDKLHNLHCGHVNVEIKCIGCSRNGENFNFNRQQYEGKGQIEVVVKEFAVREDCSKKLAEKFTGTFELKIGTSCKTGTNELSLVKINGENNLYFDISSKNKKDWDWSSPIVLKFKANLNGSGVLRIPYMLKDRKGENERQNDCDFFIELPYTISGLISQEEEDWEACEDKKLDCWCNYIRKYPQGEFVAAAKMKISDAETKAWNDIKKSKSANDFKEFLDRFKPCGNLCTNCAEAQKRYRDLTNSPPPPPPDDPAKLDKAAFDLALGKGKVELYQAYLKEYEPKKGAFVQLANDSIIRLSPIGRTSVSEPDEKGWFSIQFSNIVDPRVHIPVGGSLFIDMDRIDEFKSNGILRFKYGNRGGIIPLVVLDSAYHWKRLKIDDLNNMLEARIIEWDSSAYELKMLVKKGVPPYRIEIADENGEVVYTRTGIPESEFVIVRDSLLAKAKITGEYTVTVWDSDTSEQSITAGAFHMEVNSIWTLVIIGAGVLLAAIIVIVLLIKRRGQKQRDMYDIR